MGKGRKPERPRPTPPKVERVVEIRSVLRTVWLYCEGQTEEKWADHLSRLAVTLNVKRDRPGSARKTLLKTGRKKREEIRSLRATSGAQDEVWLVFDRDERIGVTNDASEVLQRCVEAGIGVAYSNDCFEIWPILHLEDHTKPDTAEDLQKRLKELHPGYDHDAGVCVDWPALDGQGEEAVRRAVQLHLRDPADRFANPSTTAWLLLRRVQQASDLEARWLDPILHKHPELLPLIDCLAEPIRGEVWARHRAPAPPLHNTPTSDAAINHPHPPDAGAAGSP
jgi:hypothetical protein